MSNIIRKEITRMLREAFLNDVGEFARMEVGKLPARTHRDCPLDCGMVARSRKMSSSHVLQSSFVIVRRMMFDFGLRLFHSEIFASRSDRLQIFLE